MTAAEKGETAMHHQQGRRQIAHAALIVMIVGIVALSAGPSTSARDAQKIPDQGSKANFKANCEVLGGTFIEDGLGNTECHYPDGSWTECDANGNDCWYTPARPAPPMDIPVTNVEGTIVAAPVDESAATDDDQEPVKRKQTKAKKGKKHGHGGKGRKR
jgi:hypothetical protein